MEYNVIYLDENKSFKCKDTETLIHAMQRSGVKPFPIGCRGGGCGICKIRINQGGYDLERPMSRRHITLEEEKEGIVLACCIRPKDDLKISKNINI